MSETIEITLACRADLLQWRPGDPITWEMRHAWYRRVWRWLMRRNWRVARIDFDREMLIVERCR